MFAGGDACESEPARPEGVALFKLQDGVDKCCARIPSNQYAILSSLYQGDCSYRNKLCTEDGRPPVHMRFCWREIVGLDRQN